MMCRVALLGWVVLPDDRQDVLVSSARLKKWAHRLEKADTAVLPCAAVLGIVLALATGQAGAFFAVIPLSFFLKALVVFAQRSVEQLNSWVVRHRLKAHERSGLLVRVPTKLVKLAGKLCAEQQGSTFHELFDHDHAQTRQLAEQYRKSGDTADLRKRLQALIRQTQTG